MGVYLTTNISVTSNTPIELVATPATGRVAITVFNNGTDTVYLGGSGVALTNGLPLYVGASYSDTINPGTKLYAIGSNTATHEIRLLEKAL